MSNAEYPGRWLEDDERTPGGLGWEYARRGWKRANYPFSKSSDILEFTAGYDRYICTDPRVDNAMLTRPTTLEEPA